MILAQTPKTNKTENKSKTKEKKNGKNQQKKNTFKKDK